MAHQATAKLGFCYLNGVGVSKDSGEAIRLYMVAANQGTMSHTNLSHSIVRAHTDDRAQIARRR